MDDIKILDAVERYIRGEMNPDERLYFENLRKTNPEVDQFPHQGSLRHDPRIRAHEHPPYMRHRSTIGRAD